MDTPWRNAHSAALSAIPGRDRILIRCCILAVAALAWGYLLYLGQQSQTMATATMPSRMEMTGMPMEHAWTATDAFFTLVMWIVMMVGMMAGSVMPVMLLFAGAVATRQGSSAPRMVLIFGLGYAVIWIGFSVLATLAQWALHDAAMLAPSMAVSSPKAAGTMLCLAGLYQVTPLKQACLAHCRSPLAFLMTRWRDGRLGALRMGLRHGAYCLGCCWMVMGLLFVFGVMNLVWVAVLALFVFIEKSGPAGIAVARVAGAAMIATGVFFLVGIH